MSTGLNEGSWVVLEESFQGCGQHWKTDWSGLRRGSEKTACEAAQGAPTDPCRDSRGERSPWLPLETRSDSPGEPGMQPRDACFPWRGIVGPGHTPR